jgi:hypothetical protein
MKIIYVSHSNNFDFKKLLYEVLKNSSLNNKVKFIFPHENSDEYYDTKELFNSGQEIIVLAELSYKSTGRDIEMGMAFQKDISIIGIYKKGIKISGSQKFICKKLIEYDSIEKVISEIENYLEQENL